MCVQTHLQPVHALQLHQLDDAAHEPRRGRGGRNDADPGRAAPGGGRAGSAGAGGERGRGGLRAPGLPLRGRGAGRLRVPRPDPARARRPARGPGGPQRIGQDHPHQAAAAPLRRAGGARPGGRAGRLPLHPAVAAPAGRLRAAGGAAVPPLHPREHRLRAPGRH